MTPMPRITQCQVTQCAYNRELVCHALAITVGDDDHPRCDTFFEFTRPGGDPEAVGAVGACKVTSCAYNKSLECSAPNIQVGPKADQADCLTFRKS